MLLCIWMFSVVICITRNFLPQMLLKTKQNKNTCARFTYSKTDLKFKKKNLKTFKCSQKIIIE